MERDQFQTIFAIAEDQMGYFTTAQAAEAGVKPMTVVMMARRGRLMRASHGVYRLRDYPVHPLSQYMQATLWPRGTRGILSHETALALFELSDVSPDTIHITVPRSLRIQRKTPAYLSVHWADVPVTETRRFEGMPITTPERAIQDCMATHVGPAVIDQAIRDGQRAGLLDRDTATALTYIAKRQT